MPNLLSTTMTGLQKEARKEGGSSLRRCLKQPGTYYIQSDLSCCHFKIKFKENSHISVLPTLAAHWNDLEVLLKLPMPDPQPGPVHNLWRKDIGIRIFTSSQVTPNMQARVIVPSYTPPAGLCIFLSHALLTRFLSQLSSQGSEKRVFHNNAFFFFWAYTLPILFNILTLRRQKESLIETS